MQLRIYYRRAVPPCQGISPDRRSDRRSVPFLLAGRFIPVHLPVRTGDGFRQRTGTVSAADADAQTKGRIALQTGGTDFILDLLQEPEEGGLLYFMEHQ